MIVISSSVVPDELYPSRDAVARARDVVLGAEHVRVVEAGSSDAFPIVLLHGWGASAYNYRGVIAPLVEAGYRVLAPDLRGHGSSETTLASGLWSRQAIVEWVRRLLDALNVNRCVLVGQSIGGAIALDAAGAIPDRVKAAILLAPIGFTPVRRVRLARWFRWIHPSHTPRWVVSFILRRIYGTRGRWSGVDLEQYWLPLRRADVVSAILQSAREFDFTPRDPVVLDGCRLVIRFGELDRLIPHAAAMRHAARFAGAETEVLPGVGHVPAEEIPGEIAELIVRVANEARGQRPEEQRSDSGLWPT
jgi:pimeloyl-ACP methyl ester carboxylesterase